MPNASVVGVSGSTLAGEALRASHQQPGTKTGFLGIADSLRIIRRRRWLIMLVVAAGMLLTLFFLTRTTPVYSSTATVLVPSQNPAALTPAGAPMMLAPTASEETAIQSRVELLQSRSLARQTADSLKLINDPEFAPSANGPNLVGRLFAYLQPSVTTVLTPSERVTVDARAREEAVTDNLVGHLNIARNGRSNVISITATSSEPMKAARIANRVVSLYIRNQFDAANRTRMQQISGLQNSASAARGFLQKADSAAASFRQEHGLLSSRPEDNGNIQTMQLANLLAAAQADTASETLKASPEQLPDGAILATSPLLIDLRSQEATLVRRLAELTSFYGPGYSDVGKATAELTALRARIAQETARLSADLQAQAAASQARSSVISSQIAGLRARSLSQGEAAVPLRTLERNADAVNTVYTLLLNQLNTKLGTQPDFSPDITRISSAPVPDSPSFPLPKRVLGVTFVASLALGTLLAFVIEAMDTKLRTAEQIERLLGIPTLAMIPEMDDEYGPVHSVVAGRPRSRFAEAMRNLLIEVESRIPPGGSRVIVVTSPLEDEGKNTIATSLAAAAAVIGRHAVVVDFDLRRGGLANTEGLPATREAGVVAYLAQRAAVDDLFETADEGHFAVIGVGEAAADPGALIASPRLPELLGQLRERFELMILNAPPILPVRDAKTLADYADATVLVLRWGKTSAEAAAAAMEIFGRPVTGAVLNRVDYEAHANRHYGDAIHHIARSMAYYDPDPLPGRWAWMARQRRKIRRAAGRTAEALHLS